MSSSPFVLLVFLAILVFAVLKAIARARLKAVALARAETGSPARPSMAPVEADLDKEAWWEFAQGMGLQFRSGPLLRGEIEGRRVRVEVGRIDGLTTRVQAFLEEPVQARVMVVPLPLPPGGPERVTTEDQEFDARFGVLCEAPGLARRLLGDKAREWLLALGDAALTATGTVVTVKAPGFEQDLLRLRGLVELAVEVAYRDGADSCAVDGTSDDRED